MHDLMADDDAVEETGTGGNARRRPPGPRVVYYYAGAFIQLRTGSHGRAHSLLRYLVDSGCSVTVFSFEDHPSDPWTADAQAAFRREFPDTRLVLDRLAPALRRLTTLKNALTGLFPDRARAILAWRARGASPNYDALIAESPDAVWVVNYADALTQLNGLPPAPIVVETHDVKFINAAKKAGTAPFRLSTMLNLRSLLRMRSEISVLDCAAALVAISPVEAGFFRTLMTGPDTFYIPQYTADAPVHRAARPPEGYRYDLLFVGSGMAHNVRGLSAFFTQHGPWMTSLRIGVAGKIGEDAAVRAAAQPWPNIEFLGFVDDLPALYAASKATLAPVDGTGLKIKAVEALAHGRPVFASRHAMEGMAPGYGRCVFPIERRAIERMLSDDTLLEAAQAAALAYWDGLAEAGDIAAFRSFLDHAVARAPV